jgi:hypothetical protein
MADQDSFNPSGTSDLILPKFQPNVPKGFPLGKVLAARADQKLIQAQQQQAERDKKRRKVLQQLKLQESGEFAAGTFNSSLDSTDFSPVSSRGHHARRSSVGSVVSFSSTVSFSASGTVPSTSRRNSRVHRRLDSTITGLQPAQAILRLAGIRNDFTQWAAKQEDLEKIQRLKVGKNSAFDGSGEFDEDTAEIERNFHRKAKENEEKRVIAVDPLEEAIRSSDKALFANDYVKNTVRNELNRAKTRQKPVTKRGSLLLQFAGHNPQQEFTNSSNSVSPRPPSESHARRNSLIRAKSIGSNGRARRPSELLQLNYNIWVQEQRHSLKSNREILQKMAQIYSLFDKDMHSIDFEAFKLLYAAICRFLCPKSTYFYSSCVTLALEDWKKVAGNAQKLDHNQFAEILFEIIDHSLLSSNSQHYILLLQAIFHAISGPNPRQNNNVLPHIAVPSFQEVFSGSSAANQSISSKLSGLVRAIYGQLNADSRLCAGIPRREHAIRIKWQNLALNSAQSGAKGASQQEIGPNYHGNKRRSITIGAVLPNSTNFGQINEENEANERNSIDYEAPAPLSASFFNDSDEETVEASRGPVKRGILAEHPSKSMGETRAKLRKVPADSRAQQISSPKGAKTARETGIPPFHSGFPEEKQLEINRKSGKTKGIGSEPGDREEKVGTAGSNERTEVRKIIFEGGNGPLSARNHAPGSGKPPQIIKLTGAHSIMAESLRAKANRLIPASVLVQFYEPKRDNFTGSAQNNFGSVIAPQSTARFSHDQIISGATPSNLININSNSTNNGSSNSNYADNGNDSEDTGPSSARTNIQPPHSARSATSSRRGRSMKSLRSQAVSFTAAGQESDTSAETSKNLARGIAAQLMTEAASGGTGYFRVRMRTGAAGAAATPPIDNSKGPVAPQRAQSDRIGAETSPNNPSTVIFSQDIAASEQRASAIPVIFNETSASLRPNSVKRSKATVSSLSHPFTARLRTNLGTDQGHLALFNGVPMNNSVHFVRGITPQARHKHIKFEAAVDPLKFAAFQGQNSARKEEINSTAWNLATSAPTAAVGSLFIPPIIATQKANTKSSSNVQSARHSPKNPQQPRLTAIAASVDSVIRADPNSSEFIAAARLE